MMLRAEIASTPEKQQQGLMFRRNMPEHDGMAFFFDKPQKLGFWGVGTYIPLDIAFIDDNNKIIDISDIKPLSDKLVRSSKPCRKAIEANLGFFDRHNIKIGDEVKFDELSDRYTYITFHNPTKKAQQEVDKPDEMDPDQLRRKQLQQMMNDNPEQAVDLEQAEYEEEIAQEQEDLPVYNVQDLNEYIEDSFDYTDYDPSIEYDVDSYYEDQEVSPDVEDKPPLDEDQMEEFPIPEEDKFPEFASNESALMWAELEREVVRIWYETEHGRDIEREVEPHGQFIAETTGNRIVVTFDRTVGDIRGYIIDNMLYYHFVDKSFDKKFVVKN